MTFQSTELGALLKASFEKREFLYLDQLAVGLEYLGQGLAKELVSKIDFPQGIICSAVMKAPAVNSRSYAFFEKMGFKEAGEFYTPFFRGFSGVRSAVMVGKSRPS